MAGSEVAHLLQQIREEEEAARRGLSGYATVSRHDFISVHTANMGRYLDELVEVVGSETAALDLLIADQMQQDSIAPHVGV